MHSQTGIVQLPWIDGAHWPTRQFIIQHVTLYSKVRILYSVEVYFGASSHRSVEVNACCFQHGML